MRAVEQRRYTEFAFGPLDAKMAAGFERLGLEVAANTVGLARRERKLDQFIDSHSRRTAPAKPRRRKTR